jgi:hypothetical protein
VSFELRDPEAPDDAPEPEPDVLLDPLARAEDEATGAAEPAEQDEALPVPAPDNDPPATALPCPLTDDGGSPAVGATVAAHPVVAPEFDADEDEFDDVDDAGAADPAPAGPAEEAGAADCEPAAVGVAADEPVPALLD